MINCDELREICTLTTKLTELRQNQCKHYSVEGFAPGLFVELLGSFAEMKARGFTSKGIPVSKYSNNFIPAGGVAIIGFDVGSPEGDCTVTGFYKDGVYHVQEVIYNNAEREVLGVCSHGKGVTDYCLPCGRVNGGG